MMKEATQLVFGALLVDTKMCNRQSLTLTLWGRLKRKSRFRSRLERPTAESALEDVSVESEAVLYKDKRQGFKVLKAIKVNS